MYNTHYIAFSVCQKVCNVLVREVTRSCGVLLYEDSMVKRKPGHCRGGMCPKVMVRDGEGGGGGGALCKCSFRILS